MIETLFKTAIKNNVFAGDFYLKIEKDPHYSNGNDKLVRSYNLRIFKLSLRCKNSELDKSKLLEMSKVDGFPHISILVTLYESTLQDMRKLFINSMVPLGHGLAQWVDDIYLPRESRTTLGYYGYSHRGGATFKIGDRLFDGKYEPAEEDYPERQWNIWKCDFSKSWDQGDEFHRRMVLSGGVKSVIPFKMRGAKNIETLEEAKQAAINMSDYLSQIILNELDL